MVSPNPFAPPESELGPSRNFSSELGAGQYREGSILVHRLGAEFPDRCVRCSAPAAGFRLKRRLYWHHPSVYAALLLGPVIYAITAAITRKTVTVEIGLCDEHRTKRARMMIGSVLLILASMGSCLGFGDSFPPLIGLVLLGVFGGLIWLIIGERIITASHIDQYYVRIKGVGRSYLDRLPSFGGIR